MREADVSGGCCDELDDSLIADQRPTSPVLGDERKKPVFNFVPFAGSGRQMADVDFETDLVGESLKFKLPQTHA